MEPCTGTPVLKPEHKRSHIPDAALERRRRTRVKTRPCHLSRNIWSLFLRATMQTPELGWPAPRS